MAARSFNEADIDFEQISADFAKLTPPKLRLEEVLGRLREDMVAQLRRGVSVAQLREVLRERGIEIGERSLASFIKNGVLPGRRARSEDASQTAPAENERRGPESGEAA